MKRNLLLLVVLSSLFTGCSKILTSAEDKLIGSWILLYAEKKRPFEKKTKYFEPSQKEFMINYRVENLEELVKELRKDGVTICDEIAAYDYGKFIHIMDPEGNKIELWEPPA